MCVYRYTHRHTRTDTHISYACINIGLASRVFIHFCNVPVRISSSGRLWKPLAEQRASAKSSGVSEVRLVHRRPHSPFPSSPSRHRFPFLVGFFSFFFVCLFVVVAVVVRLLISMGSTVLSSSSWVVDVVVVVVVAVDCEFFFSAAEWY